MDWVASQMAPAAMLVETKLAEAKDPKTFRHADLPSRQMYMRRIGVFEKVDGEYVGHIAMANFKCEAVIKDNPYRTSMAEPDFVVQHKNAELFYSDLGYAWDKKTGGHHVPYLLVHLDDPTFPKTVACVLVKGPKNLYFLYWDRVTITDDDIEIPYIHEELQPYVAVLRPLVNPPTQYLISIYESLKEVWDPD